MSENTNALDRRSFLKVSLSGGAGLVVGFSRLGMGKPTVASVAEVSDLNAYLKIATDGTVTIFSPNPEIGQNVKTAMPVIVAEELDVAWEDVIVEQAPLDTEKYRRQIAGGSQSIRASWNSLRTAGATARYLLLAAAAKQWNTEISGLTVAEGVITNSSTGATLSYGEVATAAAEIPVPDSVDFKNTKDFKLIGGYIKNVDGKKIVTGQPLFGLDLHKPDAVIAMMIHAPAFGMKLKSFDATEAKNMPGIYDVFTVDTTLEQPSWADINAFHELIIITGKSTWQVMKAKKLVKAEWELVGKPEDTDSHYRDMISALNERSGQMARVDGNPDEVFKTAAKTIERIYTVPFLAHNTMEPMNFYANVTEDSAELIGPIQTPEALRSSVSNYLGIPQENVTVDMTRMGGGFGRRLYGNFGLEAAAISKKFGGPVKLIYTREDDMTFGTYRSAAAIKYKAALNENGTMIAFQAKGTGIPGSRVFSDRYPAGTVDNYSVENVGNESNITTAAWRAPGSNVVGGLEQAFLDEVAEAAGKDPLEFRLELFDRVIKNPVGDRLDYDPERYAGVFKLVKEKSGWGKDMPGVFRGVAGYYSHNSYVAQVFDLVKEGSEIKIKKVWCAADCGIVVNREGAVNQLEGGIVDGIGHCMYSQLTFTDNAPDFSNFDGYQLIRHNQAPQEIEVFFVESDTDPTGLGEPSLPPVAGALSNAMYRATGNRFYNQPYMVADQTMMGTS